MKKSQDEARMYYNVLVLLDGSEAAEVILQYIPSFVCSTGAEQITLLRVLNDAEVTEDEYLVDQAEKIIRAWHIETHDIPNINIKSLSSVHRKVSDTVIDFAATNDVDAMMLASSGWSGADWWATGSVTQQIIKAASVPVYVTRLGSGRHPRPDVMKRILVPLDGSLLAEQALPFAEHIARNAAAEINLLSVEEVAGQKPDQGSSSEAYVEMDIAKYLDTISEKLRLSADKVLATIRKGPAAQQIADMAQGENFDLIVMSSHGRTGPGGGAFGGVTEGVLHGCHVPVLVIPPKLKTPEMREDMS